MILSTAFAECDLDGNFVHCAVNNEQLAARFHCRFWP